VKIDLIVRGVCALRPGVKGLSENIKVRSIVGRFLEHHRIYYFYHGGSEQVYLSSADWMERNLLRRVEVAFPIKDPKLKQRVINEGLMILLKDNASAWLMMVVMSRVNHASTKPRSWVNSNCLRNSFGGKAQSKGTALAEGTLNQ
jgi:polyphosphate kinase